MAGPFTVVEKSDEKKGYDAILTYGPIVDAILPSDIGRVLAYNITFFEEGGVDVVRQVSGDDGGFQVEFWLRTLG